MSDATFIVYAGTGHRRIAQGVSEAEAHRIGRAFDQKCFENDVMVPPYHVVPEAPNQVGESA